MNQDVKQRWIEALRSNRYQQGKGVLRDENNKYCCLGVLCDITPNITWKLSIDEDDDCGDCGAYNAIYNQDVDHAEPFYLPPTLREELNMSHTLVDELVSLNDGGSSFSDIAQFIEDKI